MPPGGRHEQARPQGWKKLLHYNALQRTAKEAAGSPLQEEEVLSDVECHQLSHPVPCTLSGKAPLRGREQGHTALLSADHLARPHSSSRKDGHGEQSPVSRRVLLSKDAATSEARESHQPGSIRIKRDCTATSMKACPSKPYLHAKSECRCHKRL